MAKGTVKVLFVNDYGRVMGGAEVYALSLARELTARGFEVRWLTSGSRGGGLLHVDDTAPPFHDDFFCFGATRGPRLVRGALQLSNPFAKSIMQRALREFRPDVIHLHAYLGRLSPSVVAPLGAVPLVGTLHTYKAICPLGTKRRRDGTICDTCWGESCVRSGCLSRAEWWHERGKRRLYGDRPASRWIAPSRYLADAFRAEGWPVEVLPYGIDAHDDRLDKNNGRGVILFAGRLVEAKGILVLLEAVSRLTDARLVVAGEGPLRETARSRAEQLGLSGRVEWVGHLARPELARRYAAADLSAVPSLWPENCSVSIIESLAFATPVVATAVGGNPELVSAEEGIIVPPGDVEAMASALRRILNDATYRKRLERSCANRAESFRLSYHVHRVEAIYGEVSRGKGTR